MAPDNTQLMWDDLATELGWNNTNKPRVQASSGCPRKAVSSQRKIWHLQLLPDGCAVVCPSICPSVHPSTHPSVPSRWGDSRRLHHGVSAQQARTRWVSPEEKLEVFMSLDSVWKHVVFCRLWGPGLTEYLGTCVTRSDVQQSAADTGASSSSRIQAVSRIPTFQEV